MPIAEKSPDSEQELRWRTWQEKGRRTDRLTDKRLKVLFSVIGLILLVLILYYTLRTKVSPDADQVQNAVVPTTFQFLMSGGRPKRGQDAPLGYEVTIIPINQLAPKPVV